MEAVELNDTNPAALAAYQTIEAQYMQMHADAVAHASYMEGIEAQRIPRTHKRWPFCSGLDLQPQMCKDAPCAPAGAEGRMSPHL